MTFWININLRAQSAPHFKNIIWGCVYHLVCHVKVWISMSNLPLLIGLMVPPKTWRRGEKYWWNVKAYNCPLASGGWRTKTSSELRLHLYHAEEGCIQVMMQTYTVNDAMINSPRNHLYNHMLIWNLSGHLMLSGVRLDANKSLEIPFFSSPLNFEDCFYLGPSYSLRKSQPIQAT